MSEEITHAADENAASASVPAGAEAAQGQLTAAQVIERIFRAPGVKYELSEFGDLPADIETLIDIFPRTSTSGKDAGKTKYYVSAVVPFYSGATEAQIYSEGGKSAPEEIVRQLWLYKLLNVYGYRPDEIEVERSVDFGTEAGTKSADIIVYTDSTKNTPKIIVECKRPKRKDGIDQLKSYMNAKGAPVAIWSNGADRVILYRPYPDDFDDTLVDLPKRGQTPKDVLEAPRTLDSLKSVFNFKKIIQDLEELVLADSGKDEFNEIFKLIFAKIWDEKEALENRKGKVVEFVKALDPEVTFTRINNLFKQACGEWPGIFRPGEDIELAKRHLQVCVGPIEGVRLMGSNLRVMDDAFEYLLPTEAKKKKGQFFTPRHVVEMCVRMLNPTRKEYVLDPACGSAGFLLHAMDWCYPANDELEREQRKHRYAAKYLWGIDFEQRAAKTSRALMLIAGDGHTNIFGPDVNSLDPRTWLENASGQALVQGLRQAKLTAEVIPEHETLKESEKAWDYLKRLKYDVILANPPFAGEIKDRSLLAHYELARPALKRAKDKQPKEERDLLFIERIIDMLTPGGRAAIVLPQGKFNNSSLAFLREWLIGRCRILAVVGLHPNTFKPHTGTKTSVILLQRYTDAERKRVVDVSNDVAKAVPDYRTLLIGLTKAHPGPEDVPAEAMPDDLLRLAEELTSLSDLDEQPTSSAQNSDEQVGADGEGSDASPIQDPAAQLADKIAGLTEALAAAELALRDLDARVTALADAQAAGLNSVTSGWMGDKALLRAHLKDLRATHSAELKELRNSLSKEKKARAAQVAALSREKADSERAVRLLTNRGIIELVLEDEDLLGTLRERWIAGRVTEKLDYPVFMAVSERGGKSNSGDYEYKIEAGVFLEFPVGHPQQGQLIVDQDLVNFELGKTDIENVDQIPKEKLCIAEAFIGFARDQKLPFWAKS